jgi:hypothetical protein
MKTRTLACLLTIAVSTPMLARAQPPEIVRFSLEGLNPDDVAPAIRLSGLSGVVTATPVPGAGRSQMAFPAPVLVDGTEVTAREQRCSTQGKLESIEVLLAPRGQAVTPAGAGCRITPYDGSIAWSKLGGVINISTRRISSAAGAPAQQSAVGQPGGPIFREIQFRFLGGGGMTRTNFAKQGCEQFNANFAGSSPQCSSDDTARSIQAGLDVNLRFAPRVGLLLGGVYRNNTGVSYDATARSGSQQYTSLGTGEIKKVWQGKVGLEWQPVDQLALSGYWAPAHTWSTLTVNDSLSTTTPFAGFRTMSREDSDHRMWGASANYRLAGPWGAQFDFIGGSHSSVIPGTNAVLGDIDATSLIGSLSYTVVPYRRPNRTFTPLNAIRDELERGWSTDFNVGYSGNWGQSAGDANALPPPVPFLTFSGRQTFRVYTWTLASGGALVNVVANEQGSAERIQPLDEVLTSGNTFAYGRSVHTDVSAGYWFSQLVGFYGRLAYAMNGLEIPEQTLSEIEARAASFQRTWAAIVQGGSGTATSQVVYDEGSTGRMAATAGIQFRTGKIGSLRPSFRVGAGTVWDVGDAPQAQITTQYQFRSGNAPFQQRDQVSVWSVSSRAFALEGGTEVRRAVTDRLDIVGGANLLVYQNTVGVMISATPENVIGTPQGATAFTSNPSIQFSTLTQPGLPQSSLNGNLENTEIYTGTGWRVSTQVTLGITWRF